MGEGSGKWEGADEGGMNDLRRCEMAAARRPFQSVLVSLDLFFVWRVEDCCSNESNVHLFHLTSSLHRLANRDTYCPLLLNLSLKAVLSSSAHPLGALPPHTRSFAAHLLHPSIEHLSIHIHHLLSLSHLTLALTDRPAPHPFPLPPSLQKSQPSCSPTPPSSPSQPQPSYASRSPNVSSTPPLLPH